ncbi:MAG: dihydroorotate dehydrogenase [Candidatus Heimdallarchaeota archaeon]|nr:dihydroorotate dehydrogenase [Candidatus Heimdallarchaeota archaeon]MBY8994130.1 dihydroorotate dehydrogenase [Candidatus Heimdallarchaeota archaeon]
MIETTIGSLKLKNPFILASGVLGVNASIIVRVANAGCGGITTKSIGPEPKAGNPNPTVVELGNGNLINAMGLPNPGCKEFVAEIIEAKKRTSAPIIASIFGKDTEEFILVAKTLLKGKPDAFELNVSCPHGGKYGSIIGQDKALVEEITREIKKIVDVPVYVKISPNLSDLRIPAEAAVSGGADGIVVINTLRAMAIDIDYQKPILANKFGGLSGPAVKPVALKCVYDMYAAFGDKVPIIGVGGISKWEDVVEFMLAGASAVQIGTAIAYCKDPVNISIFNELAVGLKKYLKSEGFSKPAEIVGLAHKD